MSSTNLSAWARRAVEDFYEALTPRLSRWALVMSIGIAVVAFAVLAIVAPSGFELGDGPLYAEYIRDGDLSYAPKHIGYYALGIAFTRVIPLPLDQAMNVMSALFAGACLGLISAIAYTLTGRLAAGVFASAVAASTYLFATNAVNAEIYVVQVAFLLACTLMVLQDRALPAGLAFAAALLTTPSSVLAVPFLFLLRPRPRFVALWLIPGALLSAAALAPYYREFLWGNHGMLNMPPANVHGFDAIRKEAVEFTEYGLSLVLMAIGLFAVFAAHDRRLFGVALVSLWLPGLILGERYSDVPVQMPLYALLAVVAGIGATWIADRSNSERTALVVASILVLVSVGVSAVPAYGRVREEARAIDDYRDTILAMAERARPNDIAVAPFASARLCQHYVPSSPITWIDDEALAGKYGEEDLALAQQTLTSAIASRGSIWLPGDFDPSAAAFFESQGYSIGRFGSISVADPLAP